MTVAEDEIVDVREPDPRAGGAQRLAPAIEAPRYGLEARPVVLGRNVIVEDDHDLGPPRAFATISAGSFTSAIESVSTPASIAAPANSMIGHHRVRPFIGQHPTSIPSGQWVCLGRSPSVTSRRPPWYAIVHLLARVPIARALSPSAGRTMAAPRAVASSAMAPYNGSRSPGCPVANSIRSRRRAAPASRSPIALARVHHRDPASMSGDPSVASASIGTPGGLAHDPHDVLEAERLGHVRRPKSLSGSCSTSFRMLPNTLWCGCPAGPPPRRPRGARSNSSADTAGAPSARRAPADGRVGSDNVQGTTIVRGGSVLRIEGAVVVVAGASSGIGEAAALAFAQRGARVVLAARRTGRLDAIVERIERSGGEALAATCDVTEPEQLDALRVVTEEVYGPADVLRQQRGDARRRRAHDPRLRHRSRTSPTRTSSACMFATRAFLPSMLARGKGHVVNIGSLAGRFATPGNAIYGATKHAVVAFSEAMNYETEGRNVRVTSVNPGFVDTEGFPQGALPDWVVLKMRTGDRRDREGGPATTSRPSTPSRDG